MNGLHPQQYKNYFLLYGINLPGYIVKNIKFRSIQSLKFEAKKLHDFDRNQKRILLSKKQPNSIGKNQM